MDINKYERQVSDEMDRRFGITWVDAGGGRAPLERAIADRESPAEFVERYGEKYGLISRDEWQGW